MEITDKELALFKTEGIIDEDISAEKLDCSYVTFNDGSEYWVLTEDERVDEAQNMIVETLPYFTQGFLAEQTGLPAVVFKPENQYTPDEILEIFEATNVTLEDFVEEACRLDGYGHFLSSYDGEEIELGDVYAYRVN